MTNFVYYPIFAAFYSSFGSPPNSFTNNVAYNGTPTVGGTPPNPSYSLIANESVSAIEYNVWQEFVIAYTAIATNTTGISTNGTAITALQTALQNLKTGATTGNAAILYNGTVKTGGTPPNPTYSMTSNEAINSIFVDIWNEFTAVYTAITGISSGVSLSTLNTTLHNFVTDFTTGLGYTSATGLVVTIGSGTSSIGGQYTSFAGGTITTTATKDNYIYLTNTGALAVIAVTISSGQPSTPSGYIPLWLATTNSSAVTSHTDLRNTTPFTASQVSGIMLAIGQGITSSTAGYALYVDGSNKLANGTIAAILGYTPENVSNKATSFGTLNNILYPTTQATSTEIASQVATGIATRQKIQQTITAVTGPTYIVLTTDQILSCDVTSVAVNTQLPLPSSVPGQTFIIYAKAGDITTNHITVTAIGGGNVRGSATLTMNTANQTFYATSDGTQYFGSLS